MNELEVTIWCCWLDKLGWQADLLELENLLLVTGIQVKEYTNPKDEMNIYRKKIIEYYPNVENIYKKWVSSTEHVIDFTVKEIHKVYKELRVVIFHAYYIAFF